LQENKAIHESSIFEIEIKGEITGILKNAKDIHITNGYDKKVSRI